MSLPSSIPGILGNTSLDQFDVLIIGSGAGGSAAAHVLTAAGKKVLVLESGDNPFPGLDGYDERGRQPWPLFSNDEIKLSLRNFVRQDPLIEPRTFRQSDADVAVADPDVNVLTRNVGGAAVISGVGYPRFTAIDFGLASALRAAGREFPGTSFIDWPFTYEEIEPFYVEAERLSGVAGADSGSEHDPFASPRSALYPLPPQPPMYVARVLAQGASQRGYRPFNLPSAINTQPYDNRPPCVSCGFCSNYGCPRNAKGSPAVTTLRKALLTGNCQLRYNAHATRLLRDATGRRITAVEYVDNDGQRQTASADIIVLAASAIESVRLCLLSDPDGPGLGNSSGHLGRHMLFHFQTIAVGIFKQRLHGERGRSVTHAISDFRGIAEGGAAFHPDGRPLGGVIEFGTSSEPIIAARESLRPEAVAFARLVGVSFKQLLIESPFQQHIAVMTMQGEDAPQPTNRVDLDPTVRDIFGLPVPRLTYRNHTFELDASTYYKLQMRGIFEAAGAAFGFFSPFDPAVPPRSRHVLGGVRFSADAADGVCDRFGKFHDLDNLYCADGGVFPTGSGYNPTLTIIAAALRTAGSIVSPGAPERILGAT
ncbi:MAG TPA: GMC family oxidoreductase [Candidatus Binatia bacterium]|nr:GMC family oxidoreductase [Candidatus Binatia bacterium]